jgi:hypothetical protein
LRQERLEVTTFAQVAHQAPITRAQAAQTDDVFRNRWRALMSVDDGIAGIVEALDDLGVSDKTYVMITSDHGWNLGQHRLPGGKHNVYDHSVRIPFVISGPGIEAGSIFDFPASNVDVAPTLLSLAGVPELAAGMDGRSVAPLLCRASDPALPEKTRRHLMAATGGGGQREARAQWRTFHPIEFAALNNHFWFGHLIDDVVSNTYVTRPNLRSRTAHHVGMSSQVPRAALRRRRRVRRRAVRRIHGARPRVEHECITAAAVHAHTGSPRGRRP